jgi:ABC-type maltose transport system permease subunit
MSPIQLPALILRKWLARGFLLSLMLFMLAPIAYLVHGSLTTDDRFGVDEENLQWTFNGWTRLFGQGVVSKWYDSVFFSPGDVDTLSIGVDDGLQMAISPDGKVTILPLEPWLQHYPSVELRIFSEGISNASADRVRGETLTISTNPKTHASDSVVPVSLSSVTYAQLDMPAFGDNLHRIEVHFEGITFEPAFVSQTFEVIVNSIKLATAATTVVVIMSLLMAYALVRLKIALKEQITGLVLVAQMFPSFLLLTVYMNVFYWIGEHISWLGRDSTASVFLIYLGSITLSVFLVMGYFRQIDADMEESAFVDGATPFQALWHILLPLSKPIIAVTFLVAFIFFYSEFNIANRMLSDRNLTFAAFTMTTGYWFNPGNMIAAMLLTSCAPVAILFLFLRKHLVSGLVEGSTKG